MYLKLLGNRKLFNCVVCFVDMVIEIRIHGRGSQGAKTAGQLLAEAALLEGKNIQASPEFGPERSGAPVKSYVKISDKEIKSYAPIKHAEVVAVIDPSLIDEEAIYETLAKSCILIVNCRRNRCDLCILVRKHFKGHHYRVDASKIALETLGKDIPNTVLLGALVKISKEKIVKLDSLKKIVKEHFIKIGKEDVAEKNVKALERGYNEVEFVS